MHDFWDKNERDIQTHTRERDRQTDIYIEVLCTDCMIQAHMCNPSTQRQRSEDREKFKAILYIEKWSRKEKQEEYWDSNTWAWMHVTLVGIADFKSIIKWWDHTRLHWYKYPSSLTSSVLSGNLYLAYFTYMWCNVHWSISSPKDKF